ncbi:hypothetical protein DS745_14635 [Anaerobacillus alkaliphilus]|uniref:Lipoprotein n=1 Tax=Anaerobacillus alkaliphilus TaxID=1548597 RepID=A0A4Q0VQP3_9BACI|nr:hypothetical protein [Anaerobacillus alkaliphilus]RXI99456.1 hypothetical protein DS745_14635 [Anaerobacillus alkaliphilus]
MRKLLVGFIITSALVVSCAFYYSTLHKPFQATIANFPIDNNKKFKSVQTSLKLIEQNDEDEYTIEWKTSSEITEKMYISHDISLLFEDGRLKETLSQAKENSNKLTQKLKVDGEDSGHFEAITFHYSELHYPNDITKSVQSMSYDQIYILDSPLSPLEYFKRPNSPSEEEGQRILDTIIKQNLQYTWEELTNYFQVDSSKYYSIPLTSLYKYNDLSLPELPVSQTNEILRQTWGTLYQDYFSGLEKHDGTIASPLGSSVPLILYHKSYSHLLIIFSSRDGEKYIIIKNLQ